MDPKIEEWGQLLRGLAFVGTSSEARGKVFDSDCVTVFRDKICRDQFGLVDEKEQVMMIPSPGFMVFLITKFDSFRLFHGFLWFTINEDVSIPLDYSI